MKAEVFLDTAYVIALSASIDNFHNRAVYLAELLEAARTRLVTTQAVTLEIGNALSNSKRILFFTELFSSSTNQ